MTPAVRAAAGLLLTLIGGTALVYACYIVGTIALVIGSAVVLLVGAALTMDQDDHHGDDL